MSTNVDWNYILELVARDYEVDDFGKSHYSVKTLEHLNRISYLLIKLKQEEDSSTYKLNSTEIRQSNPSRTERKEEEYDLDFLEKLNAHQKLQDKEPPF